MIEMSNVSKHYGQFQVLTDCSTTVSKGEVIVVCGPSGSGKSTLIKCVNGLEPFQSGKITVDGVSVGAPETDLPKLRARVGMVFQQFNLLPWLSAIDNVLLPCTFSVERKARASRRHSLRDEAERLLTQLDLTMSHWLKPAAELSVGQQQRVAAARALIGRPELVIADEPIADTSRYDRLREEVGHD